MTGDNCAVNQAIGRKLGGILLIALNHCRTNMDVIRLRHGQAHDKIGAAIRKTPDVAYGHAELRLNATVPEYDGIAFRPDIQLRDAAAKTIVIADLATTMEDQPTDALDSSSLQHSRLHKTAKYEPMWAALERQRWRVRGAALVYGSVGWVPPPQQLRRLHGVAGAAQARCKAARHAAVEPLHTREQAHLEWSLRAAQGTAAPRKLGARGRGASARHASNSTVKPLVI